VSEKNHADLSRRQQFRKRLNALEPVHAPLALNALMALQAERAGFEALYLGGGALGYEKVFLEANLSITELAQTGLEIASACSLPVILDGAAGFGDPMHMHRTIPLAEAAGFVAIEIEDQLLPKRAHHHVGIEHMIPSELMAAKVKESVAARNDDDFLIIARTNALRVTSRDDAIQRLEAYKRAGADALLTLARTPEDIRFVGERMDGPLVLLAPAGGIGQLDISMQEIGDLGYRLICDSQTVLLAQYQAAASVYAKLKADRFAPPPEGASGWHGIADSIHETIDLDNLLRIERETVEKS